MNNQIIIQNKLKYIFSKYIKDDFSSFFENFPLHDSHVSFINNSIHKFLACRDLNKGFVLYKCHSCGL